MLYRVEIELKKQPRQRSDRSVEVFINADNENDAQVKAMSFAAAKLGDYAQLGMVIDVNNAQGFMRYLGG